MRYRKKPVVIEAVQYLPENVDELVAFLPAGTVFDGREGPVLIETLEGTMSGQVGDWIIKGVQGEFYPCKPEIFEATYEPAL
jgi:hypothetical protein